SPIKGPDKKDVEVEPGDKTVKIKRGEWGFETDKFAVKKSETVTLKIEFLDGKIQVVKDDKLFMEKKVPTPTPTGVLRLDISDPMIEATVSGTDSPIKGAGKEEVKVEPGEKT